MTGHFGVKSRLAVFALVAAALLATFALIDAAWDESSDAFFTLFGILAPALALVVGSISLARYYARRSNLFLLAGAGFIGTGVIDGYHAAVSEPSFSTLLQPSDASIVPWSWFAARLLLAASLFAAWRASRPVEDGRERPLNERKVYWAVAMATVLCLLALAVVPLPSGHLADFALNRPQELLPAGLFAAALVGFLHRGRWKRDVFECWLVAALIVLFFTQAAFMSASRQSFDAVSNVSHLLVLVAYLFVLAGLFVSMYRAFFTAERAAEELRAINASLQDEVAQRQRVEADLRELANSLEARVAERTAELREINARFSLAMDAAHMGSWEWDMAAREVVWTPQHEVLFGYEAGTPRRDYRAWADRVHPDDLPRVRDVMKARMDERAPYRVEYRIVWPDGRVRWMEDQGRFFYDNEGKPVRLVGMVADVTQRKAADEALRAAHEALERKYEEIAEFVSIIVHDLKHPAVGIQGLLSLLKEDGYEGLSEDNRQNIDLSLGECERMREMLGHLSQLGRVEGLKPRRERVNLEAMLRACVDRFRPQIQKRGVRVEVDAPSVEVELARAHVDEAVGNLIDNALKYACDGTEPAIELRATLADGLCTISVRDRGPGIDPRHHHRVFQPFRRLHRGGAVGGSGIGLTAVRKMMQRIDGSVELASEPGAGARFVLRFPVKRAAEKSEEPAPAAGGAP